MQIISMDYRSKELESATRARIEALTSRWLEIQAGSRVSQVCVGFCLALTPALL